jgi:hypothetical protein
MQVFGSRSQIMCRKFCKFRKVQKRGEMFSPHPSGFRHALAARGCGGRSSPRFCKYSMCRILRTQSDLRSLPLSLGTVNFFVEFAGCLTTFFHELPIIDVDPQWNCWYRLDVENIFTISCPVCCGQAGQDGACSFPTNFSFSFRLGFIFLCLEKWPGVPNCMRFVLLFNRFR